MPDIHTIRFYQEMAKTTMTKVIFENGMRPEDVVSKLNNFLDRIANKDDSRWTEDKLLSILYGYESEINIWATPEMLMCIPKFIEHNNCSVNEFAEMFNNHFRNLAMVLHR